MKLSIIKKIISEIVNEELKEMYPSDNIDNHTTKITDEGVGYVSDKDMAKDPKHIKGDRWRVKFQSAGDLNKHGNTEMSSVNETISKKELKKVIREIVDEMRVGSKNIDNPWALAWSMKNKGMKSHKEGIMEEPFKSKDDVKLRVNHSISKPVRNPETNEWVVKWITNGKRDENKTYYTDDKKDAFDTYEQMIRNAQQMNIAGK
jgi:hypothetical protein